MPIKATQPLLTAQLLYFIKIVSFSLNGFPKGTDELTEWPVVIVVVPMNSDEFILRVDYSI